ncbi:MAG: ParB/RepB/Spo0J family partition protein [Patescibacteria group bacterium]|nr:ParB/RepB/Spo0J family partition protein [Patescibacteria group bacterium]
MVQKKSKAEREEETGKPIWILIDLIRPFKGQPRIYFNPDQMNSLTGSIEEFDQEDVVKVRRLRDKKDPRHKYELIDGERRYLACKKAGKKKIQAVVKKVKDLEEQFFKSLTANACRAGLTPFEEALAIERAMKMKRMRDLPAGQQVVMFSKIFGCTTVTIYKRLALLRLHPEVRAMLDPRLPAEKQLSLALADFISENDPGFQLAVAKKAVEKKMTLNQARSFARKLAHKKGVSAGTAKHRGPHDDYRLFSSFVRKTFDQLGMFAESALRENLLKRPLEDLEVMDTALKEIISRFTELKNALLTRRLLTRR